MNDNAIRMYIHINKLESVEFIIWIENHDGSHTFINSAGYGNVSWLVDNLVEYMPQKQLHKNWAAWDWSSLLPAFWVAAPRQSASCQSQPQG
jgi:hypothetical protein